MMCLPLIVINSGASHAYSLHLPCVVCCPLFRLLPDIQIHLQWIVYHPFLTYWSITCIPPWTSSSLSSSLSGRLLDSSSSLPSGYLTTQSKMMMPRFNLLDDCLQHLGCCRSPLMDNYLSHLSARLRLVIRLGVECTSVAAGRLTPSDT